MYWWEQKKQSKEYNTPVLRANPTTQGPYNTYRPSELKELLISRRGNHLHNKYTYTPSELKELLISDDSKASQRY